MRLELRHLRIVCAIADHGSLTKAAAALGLAQPALTAQLQRIERTLGGTLFDRDRRGARPTALGDLVLARARVVLPAVQGLEEDAARMVSNGTQRRVYRIGAVNGPILSGLVRRLAADEPRANLTTYTSWAAADLVEMLATGRLDFALVGVCGDARPPEAPGNAELAWLPVATDGVFVLLSDSHRLADKDEVDLSDLAEVQWAVTPGDGCFRACFAAACVRSGFTPRNIYEGDVRTCMELVEDGAAVALCQSSFRPLANLVPVPIAGTPLRWRHLLGWHPEAPAAKLAEQVADHAIASYQDAVARLPLTAQWLRRHPHLGACAPAGAYTVRRGADTMAQ
jgi:DNA-binding transcriptional LysR family regulator